MLFAFQFLFSCICNCDKINDYQVTYTEVDVTGLDTSGFSNTKVVDSVYRNSFGLEVLMSFVYTEISEAINFRLYGFNSASAFSCDCIGPEYVYPDKMEGIEIFVISEGREELKTSAFSIQNYQGDWLSLPEYFQIKEDWQDSFQIQLTNYEAIPDRASLKIEVVMTSGKNFTASTKTFTFI